MRTAALALILALGAAAPALAEEDEAARAARWQDLKHALFGDREVVAGTGVIALEAPARALDAATVPITVSVPVHAGVVSGRVTAIWVVVDGNPSPLAGTFRFGQAADPSSLKTRVRVDQYTLIHAVAETEDGRLFSAERYVKAAGGCSAPSSKDPQVAMSRLGQMRVRLEGDTLPADGSTVTANLLISHPNNNGMQVDQLTHNFIPPRYIQDIKVRYGDEPILSVESDISLSEDPVITFSFRVHGSFPLRVDLQDSTKAAFHQEFPLLNRS